MTARLVTIAVLVAAATLAHADDDAAAIATAARAFSAAYCAGDTTTLANIYTEDAVIIPPGRELHGRVDIARYFAPNPRRENVSHRTETASLEILGDMAIDRGTWHNTWRWDGGEPQTASGVYLIVWRRGDDGAWRMSHDMWHRPAPTP